MRPIENLILLVLLFALAWSLVPEHRRPRLSLYTPGLALALIVAHGIIEGLRWQMIPAYLLTLVLGWISLRRLRASSRQVNQPSPLVRLLSVLLALLVFIFVSQLPVLLPVFTMPDPGGSYQVGTFSLTFSDPLRPETFTDDSSDLRQIPVQVWYPAEVEPGQKPAGYWLGHKDMGRILARELGLPAFSLDHLSLVKTHSYDSAPAATAQLPYPVLIFSHGYRLGYLQQNLSIMETLASHGYVVFSVAHPYEGLAAPFAGGQLERYAGQYEQQFYNSEAFQENSLQIWVDDVTYLLDQLPAINAGEIPSILAGRLDLERLGLFGMSFGGSTASQICIADQRCKALLTLDSPQYSRVKSGQLQPPALFMVADAGKYIEREVYEHTLGPAYQVTVQGAVHTNFSDLSMVSPLGGALGFTGSIDGTQMVRIMNAYTLAFFDRHLKDLPGALLNGVAAEFPEVSIESRNTP